MIFDENNELHMMLRSREQKLGFLEIAASIPKQLEYEKNLSVAHVQNEMIVNWNMGQPLDQTPDPFPEEAYSNDKVTALFQFDRAVETIWSHVKDTLRPIAELQYETYSREYVTAAAQTRDVLPKRGYTFDFPEDRY
ncbi:MAG: hypothetical protein AAF280_07865 [Pseudomonadota bacterium]